MPSRVLAQKPNPKNIPLESPCKDTYWKKILHLKFIEWFSTKTKPITYKLIYSDQPNLKLLLKPNQSLITFNAQLKTTLCQTEVKFKCQFNMLLTII